MMKHFVKTNAVMKFLLVFALFSSASACSSPGYKTIDSEGNTSLHYAVLYEDTLRVRELISRGDDTNAVNLYGVTPLQCAAYVNNIEIMELLVAGGARTNYLQPEVIDYRSLDMPLNIRIFPEERLNFFLTFDAGSDNRNLDYILSTLKRYRIVATFFITGQFMLKYPDDVRRIAAEGHVVGNHTFSHKAYYRNAERLLDELYVTECIYRQVTGKEITRIWRAPYLGHLGRPWMLRAAERLGYRHVDVAICTADWVGPGSAGYVSNEKYIASFRKRLGRKKSSFHGSIMLMHAGAFRKERKDFVYALDDVIRSLMGAGYVFDNCGRFGYSE